MHFPIATLCHTSSETSTPGHFTLCEAFNTILSPQLPACQLLIRVTCTAEDQGHYELRIVFTDATNKPILTPLTIPMDIFVPPSIPYDSRDFLINLPAINLPTTGPYRFDIFVGDTWKTSAPFQVDAAPVNTVIQTTWDIEDPTPSNQPADSTWASTVSP